MTYAPGNVNRKFRGALGSATNTKFSTADNGDAPAAFRAPTATVCAPTATTGTGAAHKYGLDPPVHTTPANVTDAPPSSTASYA